MAPAASRKINGKKFVWDGTDYENRDSAEAAFSAYQKEGFEGEIVVEEGRYLVYTRRAVTAQSGR